MKIPIEEDLKELLLYQVQCPSVSCEKCPLHFKTKNKKYDTNCLSVLLDSIFDIHNSDRKYGTILAEEFAMWVHIIAEKYHKKACAAMGSISCGKSCKLTQLESSIHMCGVNKFHEYITRELT